MKKWIRFEYRIAAAYLFVGSIWIIFSDKILHYFIQDSDILTQMQTYKGWFYVFITGILFYLLLKKHLEKLRKAEHEAKESERLKTAFLQNISHEIRTPMNGIIGFTSLLESNNLTENKKIEYINIIKRSSNQLLSIVDDLLDISMIETGNITVNKGAVNVNKLLVDLYKTFKPLVKNEITFSLKKGLDDKSSTIITDDVKLRQILYNLLNNANKFTEKGQIEFGYTLKNNQLEFYIEDTGIGIDKKLQAKIFERFRKTIKTENKLYDGIGLGLSICKGNIDLLGGKIKVISEINKGSSFIFTIPYINIYQNEKEEIIKPTVLIVEDEESNYLYLKEILDHSKINFIWVKNGKEALDLCRNNNDFYMVFMDIKMPKMDGYQATKLIKEFRPNLPIIAQSSFVMEEDKHRILNSGFNDFIAKPFRKDQIIQLIQKYQPHNN